MYVCMDVSWCVLDAQSWYMYVCVYTYIWWWHFSEFLFSPNMIQLILCCCCCCRCYCFTEIICKYIYHDRANFFFCCSLKLNTTHSRCQKPPNIRRDTENSIILFKLCFAVKLKMIKNGGRTTFLMKFIHIYHHYFLCILYWFLDRQMLSFLLPNRHLFTKQQFHKHLFVFRFVLFCNSIQFTSFLFHKQNRYFMILFLVYFVSYSTYIYLNIERFFYSSTFGFSYDLNTRSEHLQLNCDGGRPSQRTADMKTNVVVNRTPPATTWKVSHQNPNRNNKKNIQC